MGGCKGDWKTEMQDNRNIGQRKAAGETAATSAPQDQAGDTNPDMGSLAKCAKCGNLKTAAEVYCCHGCPDVYHFGCIPAGVPKPKKGDARWFCPRALCQAKARSAAAGPG